MVYLPAEYGTNPTGVGSILGLTEMGEIKQQLAAEAADGERLHGGDETSSLMNDIFGLFVGAAHAQEVWQDDEWDIFQGRIEDAFGADIEVRAIADRDRPLHARS